LFAIYPMVEPH